MTLVVQTLCDGVCHRLAIIVFSPDVAILFDSIHRNRRQTVVMDDAPPLTIVVLDDAPPLTMVVLDDAPPPTAVVMDDALAPTTDSILFNNLILSRYVESTFDQKHNLVSTIGRSHVNRLRLYVNETNSLVLYAPANVAQWRCHINLTAGSSGKIDKTRFVVHLVWKLS